MSTATWQEIDRGNERAVLGAVLYSNATLRMLLNDAGLRPEHFRADGNVFAAMVDLADRGEAVTAHSLAAELTQRGCPVSPEVLSELVGDVVSISALPSAARAVRNAHRWRQVEAATAALQQACASRDREARMVAEEMLAAPAEQDKRTHTAEQVREAAADRAVNPKAKAQGVPFPLPKIDRGSGGGMRPGQLTVIGARQKQGKSVILDQCLDKANLHGVEPHLYLLEMSEEERVERFQARFCDVPYQKIVIGNLTDEERVELARASKAIPCGMTEAAGWTPAEVVRHARWHRFPFIAVDHMHRFRLRDEADVADCVRLFRDFAAQTGTHVILAAQLNEKRNTAQERPRPTMGDLRGSGMIAAEAHHVVMVYRPDDKDGIEGLNGEVFIAASRSGKPGVSDQVVLNPAYMRFEVDDSTTDWRSAL